MLIIVLIAFGAGALGVAGVMLATLWSSIPRSNADFQWLDN